MEQAGPASYLAVRWSAPRRDPWRLWTWLAASALLVRAGLGFATGRWVSVEVTLGSSTARLLKVLAGAAFIALAVNQQHHAPLLIQTG